MLGRESRMHCDEFFQTTDFVLAEAWHVVMTNDPLEDSDNEPTDEDKRLDYGDFI